MSIFVTMLICATILLAVCLSGADAYAFYKDRIPNGNYVPHPCKPNFMFHGVGHRISQGGGPRNPFGEDFASNGHEWTTALCNADSDGDGLTNGQELGDPHCTWIPNTAPNSSVVSHPGVCDPYDSAACRERNSWLDCSRSEQFTCDHINDPDVLNMTLRFPRTKVPAKETTYICFNFQLPDQEKYHIIGLEPFIDNENVMHHIILTGCADYVQLLIEPEECLMGSSGCSVPLGGWTLGSVGQCYPPQVGLPMGKGVTRIASLQFHWTNPNKVDTWYDSSGITLYYTPKLRQYDADILTIGQNYLNIPPGQSHWVHSANCTSRCTKAIFKDEMKVVSLQHHMHYSGIRQNVTLKRPGQDIKVMADDNPFRYDNPVQHDFTPPLTIRPGDQLETHCTFESRSKTRSTRFGEGSFDEMCFAFIMVYPKTNLLSPYCDQWKSVDFCDLPLQCDLYSYFDISQPVVKKMVDKILEHCDPAGSCHKECPGAVKEVLDSNPCMKQAWGWYHEYYLRILQDLKLAAFASAMMSCGDPMMNVTAVSPKPKPVEPTTKPASNPSALFLDIIKHTDSRPLLQNIIMNINYNNIGKMNEDNSG